MLGVRGRNIFFFARGVSRIKKGQEALPYTTVIQIFEDRSLWTGLTPRQRARHYDDGDNGDDGDDVRFKIIHLVISNIAILLHVVHRELLKH